ncbi:uncharacterized protein N7511_005839 [Penicillium nucicola]|uniref:uncharacterized protein n=1 Tax=Penicillium nucicola TaxID=1850975 RepID=UPI00254580AB|nr:uncharacterized protein N7511_005839 [Penicillium nucicola]KAJ5762457.1 hypothetical protein N7511_005839 [Penicillium nucicola]
MVIEHEASPRVRQYLLASRVLFFVGIGLTVAGGALEGSDTASDALTGVKLVKAGYFIVVVFVVCLLAVQGHFWSQFSRLSHTSQTAKTIVAPLDRVKILFQTSTPAYEKYVGSWKGFLSALSSINSHEGLRGLFRGHSATLLQKFPYAAINFLMYEQMRALFISSPEKETPLRRFLSGSISGATSVIFTYPLDLVRVRLAIESQAHKSSLKGICRQIYHEQRDHTPSHTSAVRGTYTISGAIEKALPLSKLSNFYRGFSPTLLGMLPYAGMSFFAHDTVSDWLRHPKLASYTTVPQSVADKKPIKPRLRIAAQLTAGALAGTIAQTTSYPLEVIRRRIQASGVTQGERNIGIAGTCRKIWSERGFRGFWVGLTIGYIKVVPMVATSFMVYERLKYQFNI